MALWSCGLVAIGSPAGIIAQSDAVHNAGAQQVYVIVRTDDGGMSHSVNMALQRLIASGLPVTESVIFAAPWYQETVEILKQHPEVAVGVHLALNSEWKNYRWGPVAGRSAVPALVDSDGYFFHSARALHANHPDLKQVETELRAQIERALHSGIRIDYVDYHMGTVSDDPQFRAIAERLAHEYGLAMMGYFGETRQNPQYAAAPAAMTDSLVAYVDRLTPGVHVLVTHCGIDDAELGALVDMNADGALADMSKHRQGELDAVTSRRFREEIDKRHVTLMTFRQLVEKQGLQAMRRPGG